MGTPRAIETRSNGITISWDHTSSRSVTGYVIEYKPEGGTWQTKEVPVNRNRDTIDGLQPNSDLEVRVRAKTDRNLGEPSPILRTRTVCAGEY